MNVFVAGASGAIGRPLVAELIRRGHAVTGMTRSDAGATALAESRGGRRPGQRVRRRRGSSEAVRASRAEVVIDELTALPRSPADMAAAAEGDRRLRLEGGGNLLAARPAVRGPAVRPAVQRVLPPARPRARRTSPRGWRWTPARGWRPRPHLRRAGGAGAGLRGHRGRRPAIRVLLRAGHLVPPGRGVRRPGAAGEVPVVGEGRASGRGSTSTTRPSPPPPRSTVPPGVYHVVDDDPSPVGAGCRRSPGRSVPRRRRGCTAEQALAAAGEDAVYYGTRLRGASNAQGEAGVRVPPRRLEWLTA